MLHTVNKSPFEKNSFNTSLRLAKKGSDILLIEDAVYAALKDSAIEKAVKQAVTMHSIYVLEPDLMARGLQPARLIKGIQIVGYEGFVDLAVKNDKVQSWL
ncbi:sulfurtransferase complex subunit TusB [Candidatus Spongiihabitans sp.]|uniref:sulfurtransferase complex subunit TusB n=1 Tax=Candidatus Spongiihabitans sp. TaxID=3101308 RepID=UPI003C6EBFAA